MRPLILHLLTQLAAEREMSDGINWAGGVGWASDAFSQPQ